MNRLKRTKTGIIYLGLLSIVLMFIIDYIIKPGYMEKSLVKIVAFLLAPFLFSRLDRYVNFRDIFKIRSKKQLGRSILLGGLVYGLILGTYFFLEKSIDIGKIRDILSKDLRVNEGNFIFVALYISFINSLLEEFFFRGFLFLGLYNLGDGFKAYLISSIFFAVYHVAIMVEWFSIGLFSLAMAALFVGGLIFNWMNHKNKNIYNSWLVHMFANFAINTVGFIMFGLV